MNEELGTNFLWFFGVVEDRNDPLKMGRVRVRCYYWHTEDKAQVPTDKLPWAQVLTPVQNSAMGDIGETPLGVVEGTWVFGFFMDGRLAQKPMIMGTMPGIPFEKLSSEFGFTDPSGKYPERVNEPDVNRLARNQAEYPPSNPTTKNEGRTTGVETSAGTTWDEPQSAYNAQYPRNHVRQTESGHIKEYDDTPSNERIHEFHKSGTFYEIDTNGNKVVRVVGDNYEIVAGSDFVNIKGDANLTVDGALNIKSKDLQIASETGTIAIGEGNITIGTGDVQATSISLIGHTHTDPAGIAGSQTSTPN